MFTTRPELVGTQGMWWPLRTGWPRRLAWPYWSQGIILGVLVAPFEVTENKPMLEMLWRALFRWRLCDLVGLRATRPTAPWRT